MMGNFVAERQRLDSLWPLLGIAFPLFLNWILYFVFHETNLNIFYVTMVTSSLIVALMSYARLDVSWDGTLLRLRLRPFMIRPVSIDREQIQSVEIRRYRPLREYGGWGIRQSRKYGSAYTLQGNTGLQLTLKDGKKILVGTTKPDVWEPFVAEFRKAT